MRIKKKFTAIVVSATLVFSSFSILSVGNLNGNNVANAAVVTLAEMEAKFTAINNNLRPSEVTIVTAARNQLKDSSDGNYIGDAELITATSPVYSDPMNPDFPDLLS